MNERYLRGSGLLRGISSAMPESQIEQFRYRGDCVFVGSHTVFLKQFRATEAIDYTFVHGKEGKESTFVRSRVRLSSNYLTRMWLRDEHPSVCTDESPGSVSYMGREYCVHDKYMTKAGVGYVLGFLPNYSLWQPEAMVLIDGDFGRVIVGVQLAVLGEKITESPRKLVIKSGKKNERDIVFEVGQECFGDIKVKGILLNKFAMEGQDAVLILSAGNPEKIIEIGVDDFLRKFQTKERVR